MAKGQPAAVRSQRSRSISSLGRVQGGGGRRWRSSSPPVPAGSAAELLSVPGIGLPAERRLGQVFWGRSGQRRGIDGGLAAGLSSAWAGGRAGGERAGQVPFGRGDGHAPHRAYGFKRPRGAVRCLPWGQSGVSPGPALASAVGGSPWGAVRLRPCAFPGASPSQPLLSIVALIFIPITSAAMGGLT